MSKLYKWIKATSIQFHFVILTSIYAITNSIVLLLTYRKDKNNANQSNKTVFETSNGSPKQKSYNIVMKIIYLFYGHTLLFGIKLRLNPD